MNTEQRLDMLEQQMREHTHNGFYGGLIPLSSLVDFIPTVSAAPTHTPKSFLEQFRIYSNGATYRFYWYDITNKAWRYATGA